MLDFRRLQSQLRRAVLARISSGQISGNRLAQAARFKQSHMSNFLTGKRGLSDECRDRVLRVLDISILDLIPRRILEALAISTADPEYETVPLVDASSLHLPQPPILGSIKVKRSFLRTLPKKTIGQRKGWQRFVWVCASEHDIRAMYPRIQRGGVVLVDRHYNSVAPHQEGDVSMFVVRSNDGVVVRSLQRMGNQILLRTEQQTYAMEVIAMDPKGRFAEKILGRIGWVGWAS